MAEWVSVKIWNQARIDFDSVSVCLWQSSTETNILHSNSMNQWMVDEQWIKLDEFGNKLGYLPFIVASTTTAAAIIIIIEICFDIQFLLLSLNNHSLH